jgi:hypothetical protein
VPHSATPALCGIVFSPAALHTATPVYCRTMIDIDLPSFAHDGVLASAVARAPQTLADVLQTMRVIDTTCADGDGLRWFNRLYLQVTEAVEQQIAAGAFIDPTWMAALDVQFATLYFDALGASLRGSACPGCWRAMMNVRADVRLARIQFALAGVNAHINHDLPAAIVSTCRATGTTPARDTAQCADYTTLNATLDSLIDSAKQTLHVRLLGDRLPPVSVLEDTIAAFGVKAARDKSWTNAQVLWHLQGSPPLASGFIDSLDGLTAVVSKALLVPVPENPLIGR